MTLITNVPPAIDSRHLDGNGRYTPVAAGARPAVSPQVNSLQVNAAKALEKFGAAMDAMNFGAAADHLRDAQLYVDMLAGRTGNQAASPAPVVRSEFEGYSLNAVIDNTTEAPAAEAKAGEFAGYDLNDPEGA